MNNSNTPGFIVAGAVNHLRRWCVCKENIITGSMTLRRSSMILIIVRKSGQISCVYLYAIPMIYYYRNVVFFYNNLFGNVFYVCLVLLFAVYIYCICIFFTFSRTFWTNGSKNARTRWSNADWSTSFVSSKKNFPKLLVKTSESSRRSFILYLGTYVFIVHG